MLKSQGIMGRAQQASSQMDSIAQLSPSCPQFSIELRQNWPSWLYAGLLFEGELYMVRIRWCGSGPCWYNLTGQIDEVTCSTTLC